MSVMIDAGLFPILDKRCLFMSHTPLALPVAFR